MRPLCRTPLALALAAWLAAAPGGAALAQSSTAGLRGVLLDQEGLPAVGFQVGLRRATGDLFLSPPTGKDGSFALAGLPPGRYELTAFDPRGEELGVTRKQVLLEAGRYERVELRLSGPPHPPGRAPAPEPAAERPKAGRLVTIGIPVAAAVVALLVAGGGGEAPVSPSSP
ncbi:MAG: carboxypeptidase regulatory-like domain-containing protein [Acidobacteria bacterium]|nr:MAG: carboxypeptidase regulatory-like domain-containing protein [Acidobacteriota bacterium]